MLAYYPYIAFIAKFDHARALRMRTPASRGAPRDGVLPTAEQRARAKIVANANAFTQSCRQLENELAQAQMAYPVAEPLVPQASADPRVARYWPHLFRPISYATFGHSDDLSIVLLDNLAAVTRLTALGHAMEDSDVTLCPDLSTLGRRSLQIRKIEHEFAAFPPALARLKANPHWPFVPLHELMPPQDDMREGRDGGTSAPQADWAKDDAFPPALREIPLCMVVDFKTNIMAAMPRGLALQQVMYSTVLQCIQRLCLGLLVETTSSPLAPVITWGDVDKLKCVILESQGAEDLVLLLFTTNYSLADLIVSALRYLTLGDLQQNAPRQIASILGESTIHRSIVSLPYPGEGDARMRRMPRPCRESLAPEFSHILGNHVFMQSYSTLCFAHHLLCAEHPRGIQGRCEASICFDISPGHELDLTTCIVRAGRRAFPDGRVTVLPGQLPPGTVERSLPGRHDMLVRLQSAEKSVADGVMSIGRSRPAEGSLAIDDLFSFLRVFLVELEDHRRGVQDVADNQIDSSTSTLETGFLDSHTFLEVYTPALGGQSFPEMARYLPGGKLPRPVDWPRHQYGLDFFERLRVAMADHFGLSTNDYSAFREALRQAGCPPSTQYSMIYLFQEFFSCVGDPLRCDAILDLLDGFEFLNHLFGGDSAKVEPTIDKVSRTPGVEQISSDTSAPHSVSWVRWMQRMRQFDRVHLARFLDAFQNAFTLRIQRSIPNHETRDSAFSLRSNFNKLISAMDVPLKCAVAMFRQSMSAREGTNPGKEIGHRFGAVTAVRVQQNTDVTGQIVSGQLGENLFRTGDADTGSACYWIALNIDVFHLFRPEQVFVFFHEVSHMFRREALGVHRLLHHRSDRDFATHRDGHRPLLITVSRTEECLADLVPHLFIFGAETDLFVRYHGITFSELLGRAINVSDEHGDCRAEKYQFGVLEAVFRGFLVSELIQSLPEDVRRRHVSEWPLEHPGYGPSSGRSAEETENHWVEHLRRYGVFYESLQPFWITNSESYLPLSATLRRQAARLVAGIQEAEFRKTLSEIWQAALTIVRDYWVALEKQIPATRGRAGEWEERLGKKIVRCLKQGRPFDRHRWESLVTNNSAPTEDRLDALLVVARLAREYVRITYGSMEPHLVVHVGRHDRTGDIGRGEFNRYLFHPAHASLYVVDPATREERLRAQIACIKTLWDISAEFRAQQLLRMIQYRPAAPPR